MRVLMVIPATKSADGEKRYSVLVKREISFIESSGIQVKKILLGSRSSLISTYRFSRAMGKVVNQYNPDIIHIQTGTAGIFLLFMRFGVPVVITLGGSDILGYSGNSLLWRLRGYLASSLSKMACRRADRVIAVSTNLYDALPKDIRKKSVVLPRAIQSDFFKPIPEELARGKLDWNQPGKYVVFSNPRPHMKVKNIDLAREVISIANENFEPSIHFQVIYNKSPETVLWMLNAADALLVTSFHEGSPNIVKEAMACNLPVISVPCGDVQERLAGDEYSGVAGYDPAELALLLCEVLARSSRSKGREQLAKQELTEDHFKLKIKDLYQSIIDEKTSQ